MTLDPDAEALIRKLMRERGLSFKQAVNEAIRAGLGREPKREQFQTSTFRMGRTMAATEKALRLAGQLEDEETARKLSMRK